MVLESGALKPEHLIRVMVVDDSAVVRGLISNQLSSDPTIDVVCTAANGEIALRELARRTVDVVILDIEMPVMDGLTALPLILSACPGIKVIMVSTLTRRNAEISMKALQLGATDYVPKPESGLSSAEAFKAELVAKVKAVSGKRNAPATPVPSPTFVRSPALSIVRAPRTRPTIIAIGSSTGGPPALNRFFEAVRGGIEQPILITQHMPATFTALLAEQLTRVGGRPCSEGRDGEPIQPGRCYVAPGGWHMVVARDGAIPVIRLNQEPPENFCRPAVDPMLRSIAAIYGSGALAIILTGMGSDGAKGCEAIAAAGGRFIAQDEPTSVVWGMPGAAAGTGLAAAILPLEDIGPWTRRTAGASV